jgi:hypothetical protein
MAEIVVEKATVGSKVSAAMSELRSLIRHGETVEGYACLLTTGRFVPVPATAHIYFSGKGWRGKPTFHTDCILHYNPEAGNATILQSSPRTGRDDPLRAPSRRVRGTIQFGELTADLKMSGIRTRQTRISKAGVERILPYLDRKAPMLFSSMVELSRD